MRQFTLLIWVFLTACGTTAQCPECPESPPCPEPSATEVAAAPADLAADAPGDGRSVEEVLAADGIFAWFDGTSIYRMTADHRFIIGPNGMSGRMVQGCWRAVDGSFEAVGRWSWLNGGSHANDYRRLRFVLRPPHRPVTARLMGQGPVYRSFFLLDEMGAISPDEHREGMAWCEGDGVPGEP